MPISTLLSMLVFSSGEVLTSRRIVLTAAILALLTSAGTLPILAQTPTTGAPGSPLRIPYEDKRAAQPQAADRIPELAPQTDRGRKDATGPHPPTRAEPGEQER